MHEVPQVRQHRLSKWRCLLDIQIHSGIDLFLRHRNLLGQSTQQYTRSITGIPEGERFECRHAPGCDNKTGFYASTSSTTMD